MSDLKPLKIVVLGNGPFAVPMLRALVKSSHEVQCVVIRPPRTGKGKHKNPPPSLTQAAAEELGVPLLAPASVNDEEAIAHLQNLSPDLLVVCDYGEILRKPILELAPLGSINLHGSLLPKYRGAAPIAWPIYYGDKVTGNTVIQVTAGLDSGPIYAKQETAIEPTETAGELEDRLSELGGPLVVEVVDKIASKTIAPESQDGSQATKAPRLKKSDGLIDWSRSAQQIFDQLRAMQPWPKCFTFWHRKGKAPMRIIVGKIVMLPSESNSASPGTILQADEKLVLAAQNGAIEIQTLQPAGKRMLTAEEFLRGNKVQLGERFSSTAE